MTDMEPDDRYSSDSADVTTADVPVSLVEMLNDSQREAVLSLDGPLLVVAGPGSGKTRVLTHRIAALLATGRCQPWEILAVTFTNKAAAEMRERTRSLVGEQADKIWISTFHATCARLLRMNHHAAGLGANFGIVDSDDANRVLRGVLVEHNRPAESSEVRAVAGLISRVRNAGEDATALAGYGHPELVEIMRLYERRLDELGVVDFDGLLLRTEKLLRTDTEVADRFRRRFRYVMVDEYQDTNIVQYRITRMIAGGYENICVVGDFDQSIYAWRGATPSLMAGFNTDYPNAKVVTLSTNYRSTPEIVSVCQAVIAANPAVHRARFHTDNPSGVAVRLLSCSDDRDEARTVVGELQDLPAGSSAAILLRTNAQSRAFEEELAMRRITYGVVGALRFYERAEVKDALAWLKVALNQRDQLSMTRAASVPRRGLGAATLDVIIQRSRREDIPVIDAARLVMDGDELSARARQNIKAFVEDLDRVVEAAGTGGPFAALQVVLDSIGVRGHHVGENDEARGRVENLDALLGGAKDYPGPDPYSATALFLENTALVNDAESSSSPDRGQVLIMTAHASKGKEFDWVYVCGVEDGLFPLSYGDEEPDDVDEERRLLFVACSRARSRLTLTHARQRLRFGKISVGKLSSFVSRLPDEVVRTMTPAAAGAQVHLPRHAFGADRPITRSVPKTGRRGLGPRLSASQATPGVRVRHSTYGVGVVETLGDGLDPIVTVRFEVGIRTLSLDLAPLELVND